MGLKIRLPLKVFRVTDHSMEPSIKEGDYVLASRLHRKLHIGDVVILRHPTRNIYVIKRVKQLSGGSAFVLGDNSAISEDSRSFGPVKIATIFGKVIYKV